MFYRDNFIEISVKVDVAGGWRVEGGERQNCR